MARVCAHRRLPPLPRRDPDGTAPDRRNRTEALHHLLRRLARKAQGAEPRLFYSMRQVETACGVPHQTVARVYERLEREGVLTRVRGAGTFINRRKPAGPARMHGVVALPLWLPGVSLMPHWRIFIEHLQLELRLRNLLPIPILFWGDEHAHPDFARHILRHHVDHLFWLFPLGRTRPILDRVRDAGVRCIVASWKELSLGHNQYRLATDTAIRQGLAAWRRNGLTAVWVASPTPGNPTPEEREVRQWALAEGFQVRMQAADTLPALVPRLESRTGVVMSDCLSAAIMMRADPAGWTAVLKAARMLLTGYVALPRSSLKGVCMDSATPNWPQFAKRVASDIALGFPREGFAATVQAPWAPRANAMHYAVEY